MRWFEDFDCGYIMHHASTTLLSNNVGDSLAIPLAENTDRRSVGNLWVEPWSFRRRLWLHTLPAETQAFFTYLRSGRNEGKFFF